MPGRLPAQNTQPRQPFGPQLKQALISAAPLFSSMAAGYSSGRGPYAYLDQGIAGMQAMQKQKRDEEAAAAATAAFAGLVPGGMGPAGMSTKGGTSSGGGFAPVPIDPSSPDAIAADTMTALGRGNDWLKYSNQGATRNDPLDAKLVDAMSFLPQLGITMNVISGGQEAAGEGGSRTGSTRHDHGMAADVDFYKDGRKLDWNNPDDMQILAQIVQTAKSRGVTGIGAGDDYMGAGRFHVGFGNPGVWGAGGKGANAPEWLVSAYNGAPSGGVTMSAKGETTGGGPVDPLADPYVQRLMQVMAMPGLTPEQQAVVQLQLQTRMGQLTAQSDPVELKTFTGPDGTVYRFNPISGQAEAMTGGKDAPRPMTAQERAAWGIPETDTTPYALVDGMPEKIGGGGVTVNNSIEGGGKFEEAFAKGDAETVRMVYDTGLAAQRNLGRIDQLESLLQTSPTGFGASLSQMAGEWGIATEGLSDIQAAQAIINSLVPEQRQPGSGPMSDADLELFKQSLPRIINQPGGNQIIIDTMRGIAQYDAEGARIVQRLRNGELTRAQAFDALQNRANPLAQYSAGTAPSASGAPAPGSVLKFDANGNVIP